MTGAAILVFLTMIAAPESDPNENPVVRRIEQEHARLMDWGFRCRLHAEAREYQAGILREEARVDFKGLGELWTVDRTDAVAFRPAAAGNRYIRIQGKSYNALLFQAKADSALRVAQIGAPSENRMNSLDGTNFAPISFMFGCRPAFDPLMPAQVIRNQLKHGWMIEVASDVEKRSVPCLSVRLHRNGKDGRRRFIHFHFRQDFHLALVEEAHGVVNGGVDEQPFPDTRLSLAFASAVMSDGAKL